MDKLQSHRLADRKLSPAVVVTSDVPVGEAIERAEGRWVVVTDSAGATVTAAPASSLDAMPADAPLSDIIATRPPTVVAPATITLTQLLASWVIDELEPDSAIVALGHDRVAGVWAGADMVETVALGSSRTYADTELPGEITIPLLVRTCRHSEGTTRCTAVLEFPERPKPLPSCPNPDALTAHNFEW